MKLFKKSSGKKSGIRIFISVLFLGLIAGIGWILFNPTDTSAAWYSTTWTYRKQLTINSSQVSGGADLTNFPVLVSLTDSNLNAALSTGNDILFTSSDGTTKLSHEIESFTQASGNLVAWVKIPTLSASTDTKIYLYWGNSGAASQQDATNVWDTNFKGVWHMKESTGTTIADSTGVNNGTKTSSTTPSYILGQINGAQNFIASNATDKIDAGTNSSLNNTTQTITFSAWIKRRTTSSGGYIMTRGTSGSNGYGFGIGNVASSGCGTDTITASKFGIVHACIGAVPADTNWHQIAVVWTSSGATPYIDGATSSPTNANTTSFVTSSNNARIGVHPAGTQDYFDGGIDDVKISSTNRTAGWIATEYNNQSSPSTFFSQSKVEQKNSPVLYWKLDEGTGTTANDSSANSNTGTLAGSTSTPTWQTEDQCSNGKCLKFDGSNDYVSRTYSNDTELLPGTTSFSISTWARHPSSVSGTDTIISRSNGAVNGIGYKIYMNSSGFICFGIDDDATSFPEDSACSTTSFADSKWHFIEGVKSGTSSITLYIDGNQTAQDATLSATGTLSGSSATLFAGIDSDASSNPWDGFIDDIKYSDFAKTASQIKSDYSSKGSLADTATSFGASDTNASLSQGLVGYWKLDETAANTCTGGVNDSCDSSGNAFNGAWSGNATTTAGKFGSGVTFDGTNDFADMGNPTALQITGAITVAAWVNTSASSTYQNVLGKSAAGQECYTIYTENNNTFGFSINDSTFIAGSTTYATNTWYLVVGSYVPGKSLKVYVNGKLDGQTTTSIPTSINNTAQTFVIGGNAGGSNDYAGKLDDVRVYNRTLTDLEVSQLYDWGPGPSAYWKLDDHTGTTALDSSGNANSGTLTNGPTWAPGRVGSAVKFDGSNDYIVATDNSTLQFAAGESITLEAWFKSTATPVSFISKNGEDLASTYSLSLSFGCLNVSAKDASFVGANSFSSVRCGLDDGVWHYGVYTFDRTTLSSRLYIDGVLDNSQTESAPGAIGTTADNVFIGSSEGTAKFVNGSIDEVKIYKYARSPKQILQDMNAGAAAVGGPGTPGSTSGYWSFDELSGTTANDKSGNSNNLTLSSASWTSSGKKSAAWNGTGSVWLTRSDDDDFDFAATDDFSISTWFKSDSATNPGSGVAQYLISKGTITNTGTVGYAIWLDNSGFANFGIRSTSGAWGASSPGTPSANDTAATTTDIYDGTWHNLVATKTGTSRIDLYIDGVLKGSDTSLTATGTLANSIALRVADDDADATNSFAGDLDEMKIYRYALSANDVKAEYNLGTSQTLGSVSTNSAGTLPDNSEARAYCVPGDATSCSAPVGEWKLDERTGTTANDTSGNGLTGTLNGSTAWKVGKVGAAVNFANGSSDYINVGDNSNLDFGASADFTLEAWVYRTGAVEQDAIFGKKNNEDTCSSDPGYSLYITTAGLAKSWGCDSSNNSYNLESTTTLALNTWYHVAMVWDDDSTTNTAMYINGKKDTGAVSGTLTSVGDLSNALSFRIGSESDGGKNMNGSLDQLKIYNYARTPAQVAWDYNQGGPIGWWKFDECNGSTAYDSSGQNNNGTITVGASGSRDAVGTCDSGNSNHAWYTGASGKYGSSISIGTVDDSISMGDVASYDFDTNADLSIEAWINRELFVNDDTIIAKRNGQGAADTGFSLWLEDPGQDIIFEVSDGTNQWSVNTLKTITATGWHHIVAVFDQDSDANSTIYLDGVADEESTSGTIGGIGSLANAVNFTIGTEGDLDAPFAGDIDNVKIYNYALNSYQVKTLYNENSAIRFGQ